MAAADDLRRAVDEVIALAGDPESFHGAEDGLMQDWIEARATPEELEQWKRLWEGHFIRWYA